PKMFYCINPSVDASHSFTLTGGNESCIAVFGFSAEYTILFDGSTILSASGTAIKPGAITPTIGDALLCTVITDGWTSDNVRSIDSGFTKVDDRGGTTSFSSIGTAYKIISVQASEDPEWTGIGSINRETMMG